jgi:hypothetical protein
LVTIFGTSVACGKIFSHYIQMTTTRWRGISPDSLNEVEMAIAFPNKSRSYDADQRRIRFWGYEDAREVSFFVEENAIFKLAPRTQNVESGILSAFDAARDRIMQAAAKAYDHARGQRFYILAAADF